MLTSIESVEGEEGVRRGDCDDNRLFTCVFTGE